jgi:hypothetical protein
MEFDEIHYKGWRIAVLHQEQAWKALIYRPGSPLHEEPVPTGSHRRAIMQEAKMLVDQCLAP